MSESCPTLEETHSTLECVRADSRADCDEQIPADDQSDLEDAPNEYISLRITCPHDEFSVYESKVFYDFKWYISYPHFGKNGNNQHFHVFLPGSKPDAQRCRDRVKKLGCTGNKQFSLKCMQNGLGCAIQYGSKEKTTPIIGGDVRNIEAWIRNAPKWLDCKLQQNLNPNGTIDTRGPKRDANGIKLTGNNFLKLCFQYAYCRDDLKNETDITIVMMHMLDGDYYFDAAFARNGVPDFYLEVYAHSVKKGKISYGGSRKTWKNVIFRPVNIR